MAKSGFGFGLSGIGQRRHYNRDASARRGRSIASLRLRPVSWVIPVGLAVTDQVVVVASSRPGSGGQHRPAMVRRRMEIARLARVRLVRQTAEGALLFGQASLAERIASRTSSDREHHLPERKPLEQCP